MFQWIRRMVRSAFVAGAADAARDLGLTESDDNEEAAVELRAILAASSKKKPLELASGNGSRRSAAHS